MLKMTLDIVLMHKYGRANIYCIYGPRGGGKSALALKVLGEVYGEWSEPLGNKAVKHYREDGNLDFEDYVCQRDVGVLLNPTQLWSNLKDYIVWRPDDFLDRLDNIINKDIKLPAFVWDDAGYWLCNFDWNGDFQKAVGKYMQLSRENFTALIFTSLLPTDIMGKISKNKVEMRTVRLEYNGWKNPWSRVAKMYGHNILPDLVKSTITKPDIMYFNDIRLSDDLFLNYHEMRKSYNTTGKEDMRQGLKQLTKKAEAIYKKASEKHERPDDVPVIDTSLAGVIPT